MPIRIPWNQHEIALLINAYLEVAAGADLGQTAAQLSLTLRNLAVRSGIDIDDTYRNVNGMKMQLGNVRYLFTDGKRGLSGSSSLIRLMFEMYKTHHDDFQQLLKEAIQLTGQPMSVEEAFFAYAKDKIGLSPKMLSECLKKAADYCHLKQPLLGMTDVKAVRNAQQKVAEGKLLRFRYGKDAQPIRNATQLYYNFVKSYHEKPVQPVEELVQPTQPGEQITQDAQPQRLAESDTIAPIVEPAVAEEAGLDVPTVPLTEHVLRSPALTYEIQPADDTKQVDFSRDASYEFTKPISCTYRGKQLACSSWNKLYVDLCGRMFDDYHDAFMTIMNSDVPSYSTLAFADEQHKPALRYPRSFAPGYYLEGNIGATNLVRRISGLCNLFSLGSELHISYRSTKDATNAKPDEPLEEWIIVQLKARKISYQDKRPLGGCLWIRGNIDIPLPLNECHEHNYHLHYKPDGCKVWPNEPAWWTTDQPEQRKSTSRSAAVGKDINLGSFRDFLVQHQHLAERTANGYVSALRSVEGYIQEHHLPLSILQATSDDVQSMVNALMARADFVKLNIDRHHQFGAALAQYVSYLTRETSTSDVKKSQKKAESSGTIKDAVVTVLQGASSPMSAFDILEQIQCRGLYQFNADNPLSVVTSTIRQHCVGIEFPDCSEEKPFRMVRGDNGMPMFYLKEGWSEQIVLTPPRMTIKDAVIAVLRGATEPMRTPAILEQIQRRGLYQFNTKKPLPIVLNAIRLNCEGVSDPRLSREKTFRFVVGEDGKQRYLLSDSPAQDEGGQTDTTEEDDSILAGVREHILSFASESFPHGIRPASIIDLNKLKRIYQTKIGEEIPADVDVTSLLRNIGLQSGEKVYFLSEDQKQSLRSLITGIVEDGHRMIYYSELLSLHGDLFEACHIYESPLIRSVLSCVMPAYIYKAEWMLADRDATEIEEITRAFGEDVVLTYQQLKNRCPYLTLDVIKWALSRSDRFVWSSPETYAQTDLIELDQVEVNDIVHRILPLIQEEGYYSLAQLPMEESCGMNPQVSSSAVRDAIYNRYMAGQFTRNGLIVKRPEIHLTTYQVMETWLKGLEQVTLTEVEDYERELTGHHAVLGIAAASNSMVRIDHDHYVSDASIQFDVEAVDRAVALFAGNRIISISAITSFTSFPEVPGYTWNLYLVESFLRRFSKRFTIDGGPAQMSYVGGICSADRHFENYEDRLAHAVIQDGIALTEDTIGRYLTERKYILRRSETVRKTLERARILNEQRGDPSVRI